MATKTRSKGNSTARRRAPAKKAAAPKKRAAASAKRKAVSKKTTAKKTAAKKTAVKKKAASKRPSPARKALAKKAVASKKATPKKSTAKKPVAKKAAAKKPAPKKVIAKKPAPKAAAKKAPVKAAAPAHKPAHKPVAHKAPAPKAPVKPPVKAVAPKVPVKLEKPFSAKKLGDFAVKDYVVYPTHGVGQIDAIEEQIIAGYQLRLFVINFEKEKMTLRVPVDKADEAGLRKLSSRQQIDVALTTLKGRSRVSRAMWSRRAQEYEAKINSGDPVSIAEVVRDLHRNAGQPDQSYSERQIYEAALERLARELAAVEKIDADAAAVKLEQVLEKAA